MPWRTEQIRATAVVVAGVIILCVMALPLLTGSVYASDDLGWFHLPLRVFYARSLAAGDDPAWCPNLFCGFYLQGEGQVGMTHPAHLLFYRLLPVSVAFNLELLIGYPLSFLGFYLVLRSHQLPSEPAWLGSFICTFAGYNLLHYRHINSVAILAHLPWLLLAIRHTLQDGARGAAWGRLAVGLLTASQLTIGHPQTVWYSALVESVYALALAWHGGWGIAPLVGLAVAKTLGILGGAIQWLPTLAAIQDSIRQAPTWNGVTLGSLHPLNLVVPIAPYLFAARVYGPEVPGLPLGVAANLQDWRMHEYGMYLGACVPALLGWLALRWRNLGTGRSLAKVALWIFIPALLIAFGRYTPVYRLVTQLPLVGYFRVPARYLLLVHLAEAALVAVAYADLCRVVERREKPPARLVWLWFLPLAALVAVLFVPLLCRLGLPGTPVVPLGSLFQRALGVSLVLMATGLVVLAAQGKRRALLAIVLFLAADIGYYSLSYMRDHSIRPIAPYLQEAALPGGSSGMRVRQTGETENAPVAAGLLLEGGYAALAPRRMLPEGHPKTLQLEGVGWEVSGRLPRKAWNRVADPLPLVRLVATAVATTEPAQVLDTIDLASTAMIEPGHEAEMASGPPGTAELITERPGAFEIRSVAPDTRLLVVSESYHEGWSARVDGTPVERLRVNGDFLGCYVPAGSHRVTLQFAPASLARGRVLSFAGLSLLIGWTVAVLARPRPGDRLVPAPHLGVRQSQLSHVTI